MQTRMVALGTTFVLLLTLTACESSSRDGTAGLEETGAPSLTTEQQRVVNEIEALDAMRSGLAGTIPDPTRVDQNTFAEVCKPVGQRAQALSKENNWIVRQLAAKYRNPSNAAPVEDGPLFDRFESDKAMDTLWVRTAHSWRYLKRITVEQSCLVCHGAEENRPDFVRKGYPEDRAYGFDVGDLRGLYSVVLADSAATDIDTRSRP